MTRQEAVRRARLAISERLGLELDDETPEALQRARAG